YGGPIYLCKFILSWNAIEKHYGAYPMKRQFLHFLKNRQGSAMLEFALIGPPLLLLIFGLFETSRLYYIRNNLQNAAYEGGRYAMLNVTASSTVISQKVSQNITAVSPSAVTITIQSQTINGKPFKQISLAYNFSTVVG